MTDSGNGNAWQLFQDLRADADKRINEMQIQLQSIQYRQGALTQEIEQAVRSSSTAPT